MLLDNTVEKSNVLLVTFSPRDVNLLSMSLLLMNQLSSLVSWCKCFSSWCRGDTEVMLSRREPTIDHVKRMFELLL